MKIEIITEPSIPQKFLRNASFRILQNFQDFICDEIDIHHTSQLLSLTQESEIDELEFVKNHQTAVDKDYCLIIVNMPITLEDKLIVAKPFHNKNTLIISYPALGLWNQDKRLASVVRNFILDPQKNHTFPTPSPQPFMKHSQVTIRTILGMVRGNKPFQTLPALSGALAAALTAGAFGIFYSSIWQMAESLSLSRLCLITFTSIGLMTIWLLISHKLWSSYDPQFPQWLVNVYNLSAVATLLFVISVSYVFLLSLVFLGSVIVISPDFMEKTLGVFPGIFVYFKLSWLSASMGVIAGGIGSGFDSSIELKQMTQSGSYEDRIKSN